MRTLALALFYVAVSCAQQPPTPTALSPSANGTADKPQPAPGNPLLGGPLPSVIPYASLNQWSAPDGGRKDTYRWQVQHMAAAHGGDQAAGSLNADRNFYFVKYRLLESELTSDPSIGEAIRYCTKTLGQSSPESLFYHYQDDTVLAGVAIKAITRKSNVVTVTLAKTYILDASVPDMVVISGVADPSFNGTFTVMKVGSGTQFRYSQPGENANSSGGSAALNIRGCGMSGACSAENRVVHPAYGGPPGRRYIWNHGDETCARPYLKYRSRSDLSEKIEGTSGHFRAIFWDELGQADFCTIGHSAIGCTAMPEVVSGGIVKELGSSAQQAVDAHAYDDRLNGLLAAITADLHALTKHDALTFPNAAQCPAGPPGSGLNVSCYNHAMNSDGMLTEFWDDEGQSWVGSKGVQTLWRSAETVLAQKKVFVWAQDDSVPTKGNYGTCGDHYASPTMRHQMWSLANYWMIKQANYAWYGQQPVIGKSYSQGFIAAQQQDIGQPTGGPELCSDVTTPEKDKCQNGNRYLWKNGTDSDGHPYQIYRRNYSAAIVLSTPRLSNEDGFPPNYAATTADVALPGTYLVLQGDGSLSKPRQNINMCRFEAVVLVPAKP
jgi:hypothetical protein